MLVIAICAGCVFALVANVFGLIVVATVCGCVYLTGMIVAGAAHPALATAIWLAALQAGYAVGMVTIAYLPANFVIGRGSGDGRYKHTGGVKGRLS